VGEPSWPGGGLGRGRPGWHIECSTIALRYLGSPFDIQGGGTDLVFPHHEMSAAQAAALTGRKEFARAYVHQAMVAYAGEKMSKSKGNLVLVSRLREDDVDPMAIRLVLLAQHYRTPWEYHPGLLREAEERLARWRAAACRPPGRAEEVVTEIRRALAEDLDAPTAVAAVDEWAAASRGPEGPGAPTREDDPVVAAVQALLGVRLLARP
jgi:L-cysteine:1D-myo-inositol 2-amino-2-deoxy-alpha-D-glucopyranoside ligase